MFFPLTEARRICPQRANPYTHICKSGRLLRPQKKAILGPVMEPLLPAHRVHGRSIPSRTSPRKGNLVVTAAAVVLFSYGVYLYMKTDRPRMSAGHIREPVKERNVRMKPIPFHQNSNVQPNLIIKLTKPVKYDNPLGVGELRWCVSI